MADTIAPDGSEITLIVTDAVRASLVGVRLPAGQTSRPVRHRTVEEIWHFTAGSGRVWRQAPGADAQMTNVEPGSTLVIPTGCAFRFEADPESDLQFLCYTSPPWPGEQEAELVSLVPA